MVTKSGLDNLLMCTVDSSPLLMIKPKSHTVSTQVRLSFPICTAVFLVSAFNRFCFLSTMKNFILLSFSFKKLSLIQSLISCMQFFRLVRHVSLSPLWLVQNLDIPAGHQHSCDIQCHVSGRYSLRGICIV